MAKVKKRPKVRKKTVESPSPLREIVGDDVYDVWVAMLKGLVPAMVVLIAFPFWWRRCWPTPPA